MAVVNWGRKSRSGALGACLLIGGAQAFAFQAETVKIPSRDPARARSTEANIAFGEIVDQQDKRLDVRDRAEAEAGLAAPTPATVRIPVTDPEATDNDPRAKVDVQPTPHVDVGMELKSGDTGVLVLKVVDNSPAARAKLAIGDVITKVGDKTALTEKDFDTVFNANPPGARIPLAVERDQEKLDLVIVLPDDHTPHAPAPPYGTTSVEHARHGIKKSIVDEREMIRDEAIGWVLSDRGETLIEVTLVLPNTPAARAGVMQNDIVLGVDNQRFTDPGQAAVAVHQHQAGEQAIVTIRRGTRQGNVGIVIPNVDAANPYGVGGTAQSDTTVIVPLSPSGSNSNDDAIGRDRAIPAPVPMPPTPPAGDDGGSADSGS